MGKNGLLIKWLAIVGTVLVWFPILATFVITVIGFAASGILRFDYLMPAEFSLVGLTGGGLLLLAALLARARRALIGWGLGAAVVGLVGSQGLAVVTGLASGDTMPEGLPWILVLGLLAVYSLALVVMGVGGVLLVRDLLMPSTPDNKSVPV
jgi:hypothetical protein